MSAASAAQREMVKYGAQEAANFLPPNHNEHERFAMAAQILTQDYLKSILHYDPETGVFTRLVSGGGNMSGTVVGSINHGYRETRIKGKKYLAHRLAFLYMTGRFPLNEVDHINGCKDDNRWKNLREVSHRDNLRNQRRTVENTSGFMGVRHVPAVRGRITATWQAFIYHEGKSKHLGNFVDIRDAIMAREKAKRKYGYHPNHGRKPLHKPEDSNDE